MPRSVALSFELLRTFVSLICHGGEGAAVMKELGLQPAYALEAAQVPSSTRGPLLDRPWLVREGKTWKLTDEGQRIWPAALDLVDRYQNLHSFVEDENKAASAALVHFACGQAMAAGLVRRALLDFRERHPDRRLRISTLRGPARIEGVSNGSLDLAIVSQDEPTILEIARRSLYIEPLGTYRLALVCAAWHEMGIKAASVSESGCVTGSLSLVSADPARAGRERSQGPGLGVLRARGLLSKLDIVLEVGGWATILAYVRDGVGVGLVSEGVVEGLKGFTVRPLDGASFHPTEAKLICRRLVGSGEGQDLTAEAMAWWKTLERFRKSKLA